KVGDQPVDLNFIKRKEGRSLPWYEDRKRRSHLRRSHHDTSFTKSNNNSRSKKKPELEFNCIIQLRENAYKAQLKKNAKSEIDQVEDIDEFPPTMPPDPPKPSSSTPRARSSSHHSS